MYRTYACFLVCRKGIVVLPFFKTCLEVGNALDNFFC